MKIWKVVVGNNWQEVTVSADKIQEAMANAIEVARKEELPEVENFVSGVEMIAETEN
jgi:hypothetical protein